MRTTSPRPSVLEDPRRETFFDQLHHEGLSSATVRGYRYDLGRFFRWLAEVNGPKVSLEQVTQADLLRYREHLVGERSAKPATVNRHMEALRRLCQWAYRQKILKLDLAEDMKRVRQVKRHRPPTLEEGEIHALLRGAGESRHGLSLRNYGLVQCLLQTGVRVSEICALEVGDAVLRDRTGVLRVRQGKGRKDREIPLNASVRRALRQYLESRQPQPPQPDEPLFASTRGGPMSMRAVQHFIAELARRARVTRFPVTVHTFRHTFAQHYLRERPGNLHELALLLGHESLEATTIYTRPSLDELARHLEKSPLNVYP